MLRVIDTAKLQEARRDTRNTPWANMGTPVSLGSDGIKGAQDTAGLNWDVKKYPMEVKYPGHRLPTDWFATVREDNKQVLGVVTGTYKLVQNRDALDFIDHIPDFSLERSGEYAKGAKMWLAGRFNEPIEIAGDTITPNVIFFNSFDGSGAVKIAITPVRVACHNALAMALRQADQAWNIRHSGDVKAKVALVHDIVAHYHEYAEEFKGTAEIMLGTKVSAKQVDKIITALWPVSNDSTMAQENRILEIREDFKRRYAYADINNIRGTAWGVLNAVSDTVTHMAPIRNSKTRAERLLEAVATVHPTIQEAKELLLASQ